MRTGAATAVDRDEAANTSETPVATGTKTVAKVPRPPADTVPSGAFARAHPEKNLRDPLKVVDSTPLFISAAATAK